MSVKFNCKQLKSLPDAFYFYLVGGETRPTGNFKLIDGFDYFIQVVFHFKEACHSVESV